MFASRAPGFFVAAHSSRAVLLMHFKGLGLAGLKLLAQARAETGLAIVTEVMSEDDVPLVAEYADILQIGSRSMENFTLIEAAAQLWQADPAQARHDGHDRRSAEVGADRARTTAIPT